MPLAIIILISGKRVSHQSTTHIFIPPRFSLTDGVWAIRSNWRLIHGALRTRTLCTRERRGDRAIYYRPNYYFPSGYEPQFSNTLLQLPFHRESTVLSRTTPFVYFSLFRKVLFYCSFIKCTMAHEVTGCFTGYADVQHLHLHNRGSCSPPWPPVKYGLGPPETGALQQ